MLAIAVYLLVALADRATSSALIGTSPVHAASVDRAFPSSRCSFLAQSPLHLTNLLVEGSDRAVLPVQAGQESLSLHVLVRSEVLNL